MKGKNIGYILGKCRRKKKLCAQLSLPKGALYDFFEIVFMEYYLREVAEKREK